MQKVPATGKVRNIGVSNFGIQNLEKLRSDPTRKPVPAVKTNRAALKQPESEVGGVQQGKRHSLHGVFVVGEY